MILNSGANMRQQQRPLNHIKEVKFFSPFLREKYGNEVRIVNDLQTLS